MKSKMVGSRKKKAWNGGNRVKQEYRMPLCCAAGSVVLYVMLTLFAPQQGPIQEDGTILRAGYGSAETEYDVLVKGLEEEEIPLRIRVGGRIYTRQEAEMAFEEVMESLPERIRGDNESLMEVRRDLKLPARIADKGIRIHWYSSEPGIMDLNGKLLTDIETAAELTLSVELVTDIRSEQEAGETIPFSKSYELPIRIVPDQRDPKEQLLLNYQKRLRQEDDQQQHTDRLCLPMEYEGRSLSYRSRGEGGYGMLLLLGLLSSVLLWAKGKNGEKELEKKRERELLLDYADLLSKLMVLTGAGLTIRNAWEKMAADYETAKISGRQMPRAAYEEMSHAANQMRNGTPEGDAYKEFGRRCHLQQYLKLAGMLEQNRRSGTKNLRQMFQTEVNDALEQRKNLARRLGEEAGTKLLAPLFLLLGIVMVMIMVPAMLTMG